MQRTKLTYEEFCALVGLAYMAKDTDKTMLTIVRAVARMTGEVLDECDYGHASDFVYAPDGANPTESTKLLLSKMGIVYEKEATCDEETEVDTDVPVS